MISVIIPVYNREKTIEKCLNSVINQTYSDIEIIVVNDGSVDKSEEIIKAMALNDNRIKLITTENRGPAAARNTGLDMAKGDYLAFVDADDWIELNTYELMMAGIEKNNAEMCICGYQYVDDEKVWSINQGLEDGYYNEKAAKEVLLNLVFATGNKKIRPFIYLRLIKKSVIDNMGLRFNEKMIRSEDYLFLITLHMNIKSIEGISSKLLYNYYQNQDSITHKYIKNYFDMFMLLYNGIKSITDDTDILERLDKLLISRSQMSVANELKSGMNFSEVKLECKRIFDNASLRKALKKISYGNGRKIFGISFIVFKLNCYPIFWLWIKNYYRKNKVNKNV